MLILGIDPGTATTGYGLIEVGEDYAKRVLISVKDYGLIETEKNGYSPKRYQVIYRTLNTLLEKWIPDYMVIEKIFFATNAKTAIKVGQAQGVMMLAAAFNNIEVAEYAPGTIKKVITGSGRAKKKEVQECVVKILGRFEGGKLGVNKERRITKTHIDNMIDAFAIAMTHASKIIKGFEIINDGETISSTNANAIDIPRLNI